MDEDIIIEPPAQKQNPEESGSPIQENETVNTRFFDITPDLNISLVKDEEGAEAAASRAAPIKASASRVPVPPPVSAPVPPPKPAPAPDIPAFTPRKSTIPLQNPVIPNKPSAGSFNAPQPVREIPPDKIHLDNPSTKTISAPNTIFFGRSRDMPQFPEEMAASKTPDPNKKPISQDPNIKAIRTYESDLSEAMSRNKVSKASIAIAESSKKEGVKSIKSSEKLAGENSVKPSSDSHFIRNLFYLILSLVIIGGGIFGSYYLYSQSPLARSRSAAPSPALPKVPSGIIISETQEIINIDNLNAATIQDRLQSEISKSQTFGSIKEVIPVKSQNEEILRISAPEMVKLMGINAPDIFVRSLDSAWMLGSYTDNDGITGPFVIVTNNFFQNAFAGILQWESAMPADLKQFTFTNDGSNTTRGRFIDRIIKNKDVREFISENGEMLFLYSFVSNDKLVITDNENVLSEIIARLDKKAFIR